MLGWANAEPHTALTAPAVPHAFGCASSCYGVGVDTQWLLDGGLVSHLPGCAVFVCRFCLWAAFCCRCSSTGGVPLFGVAQFRLLLSYVNITGVAW